MKRIISILACICLLFGVFSAAMTVSAAPSQIRVVGLDVEDIPNATAPSQYIHIYLDNDVNNARQCQTTERVYEAGLPEDSWDFPDSLTDAARKYILVNGTKLGDYIDAIGSAFAAVVCYQKPTEGKYANKQLLSLGFHSDGFPGTNPKTDDYTVEIKTGFFASVDGWKTLVKFEPTVFTWDHKAQKMTVKRKGDGGKTLEEALSGGGDTTTSTPTGTTSTPSGTASTPTGTTSTPDDTSSTDTSSEDTSSEVEVVIDQGVSTLQVTDILSLDDAVKVDFEKNTVTLDKSMSIKELMEKLNINTAYKSGIYNGKTPVEEDTPVYTGYKLKIYEGENLIGNLYVEAPEPEETTTISPLIWVIVAVGIALVAVIVALVIVLLRKKKGEVK